MTQYIALYHFAHWLVWIAIFCHQMPFTLCTARVEEVGSWHRTPGSEQRGARHAAASGQWRSSNRSTLAKSSRVRAVAQQQQKHNALARRESTHRRKEARCGGGHGRGRGPVTRWQQHTQRRRQHRDCSYTALACPPAPESPRCPACLPRPPTIAAASDATPTTPPTTCCQSSPCTAAGS